MAKEKDLTNGGFTQKEMLVMLIEGQTELDKRIDLLHEKVNTKLSRQELSGWLVAVSALGVLVNTLM
tara:strand:+ start:1450 stop:1650 length:201 start_codon:yes stop_codon:yes gene_type:complete